MSPDQIERVGMATLAVGCVLLTWAIVLLAGAPWALLVTSAEALGAGFLLVRLASAIEKKGGKP